MIVGALAAAAAAAESARVVRVVRAAPARLYGRFRSPFNGK